MLFRHKNRLQVDLGDLQNEKEHLLSFLQSKLKGSVTLVRNKLTVHSEKLSAQELQHIVTKFIYRRKLNNTHWASIKGMTIKINRFKGKTKKNEKHKKNTSSHKTAIQSWGL